MQYQLAIFDFDGTLADSFPFFISVFHGLAEQHGFRKLDPDDIPALRHRSARELMQIVGLPKWKLPLVAASFIALMREKAEDIALFPGVDDMLHHLSQAGVRLAIITSNSHDNVVQILGPANTGLISHSACGMSIFGKATRIRNLLEKTGVPAARAIYIGDQVTDLEAARKEGVAFGAVSWGYGTIESLRKHAPEEEFDTVPAIKRLA
ncbi:MAG TPA: HAD hydrolase-like protein [Noviherbaspirillum sp.]|uniref:HAD hydrolase-like protein n=1 Tax=Noviherbaspirillum sp. TaxID=1926288 RepID=UPI002D4F05DA|nr:HAD hydrolase-like protein [Noviherbaspirillum sp.]HYD97269.1 HAD hydrolase-like protein [Noviherbaspirillum sp.]